MVRLVRLNMFYPPPPHYFYWPFQGGASFVDPFVIWVLCLSLFYCLICSLQSCDHLLGKTWPLGSLVCSFRLVLSLSHIVSWVKCGTWLYLFMIFAYFLTFILGLVVFRLVVPQYNMRALTDCQCNKHQTSMLRV